MQFIGFAIPSEESILPTEQLAREIAEIRNAVEKRLAAEFDRLPASEVRDAARYAALGGGHRWRAIVAVAAGRIFRTDALDVVLPFACGAELAHAASLVLDDLPSMDNAQMRRGKPCTHLLFPNWAVDMTPTFLVNMAYEVSLANPRVPAERRIRATLDLSAAATQLMVGQVKDLKQDHAISKDGEGLLECYRLKSGALFASTIKAGGILCGASDLESAKLHAVGLNLGTGFQFLDDIADVIAGVDDVGKERGMDRHKWTSVDWLGFDETVKRSEELQAAALKALDDFGSEADLLRSLVREANLRKELEISAAD